MRLALLVAAVATVVVGLGLVYTVSSNRAAKSRPLVAKPILEEPNAPKGDEIENPHLREARDQADALMAAAFAGKVDDQSHLAPVARKVDGYHGYCIKFQQMLGRNRAEFCGVLTGGAEPARFSLTLVEQNDGKWEIGTFSGPEPE